MCCFSQPVEHVSGTNIFARGSNGNQFLVYSMTYAASADLAMVLPLPVSPAPADDAVRFINLESYPDFFEHLRAGFPPSAHELGLSLSGVPSKSKPNLKVHNVGSFEASFVPRLEDFDRLDERFRIPGEVWEHLPVYRDYGFAVFKLKKTATPRDGPIESMGDLLAALSRRVHPMALAFPRRNPDLLYFPTVHVHDRNVHPDALFDHMLYCQPDSAVPERLLRQQDWKRSSQRTSVLMDVPRTAGIIDPAAHVWRRPMKGRLPNRDTLAGKHGVYPALLGQTPGPVQGYASAVFQRLRKWREKIFSGRGRPA